MVRKGDGGGEWVSEGRLLKNNAMQWTTTRLQETSTLLNFSLFETQT